MDILLNETRHAKKDYCTTYRTFLIKKKKKHKILIDIVCNQNNDIDVTLYEAG